MSEPTEHWERGVLETLASGVLREQRAARRWKIFFRLLTFFYIGVVLVILLDLRGKTELTGTSKHTALVDVSGIIGPGADASAEKINAALQAAFKDGNTKGVVVRINSPGGSPVQAQSIYDEMRRLRTKYPNIPLYAVVEDICASGGYFVAAGADRIYVGKASIVGSIGVRMDGFGATGLMQKLGIERRLLTAGANKGFLDPFLPADEKQKQHAQAMLNEIHQQFIAVVREGRGTRLKERPDLFSGLVWTGEKSIALGLAHSVGSLEQVARDVIQAEEIVDFTQKENLAEKVARRFGAGAASAVLNLNAQSPAIR